MTEGRRKQKPDHETGITPGAGLDVWLPSIMDPAATYGRVFARGAIMTL